MKRFFVEVRIIVSNDLRQQWRTIKDGPSKILGSLAALLIITAAVQLLAFLICYLYRGGPGPDTFAGAWFFLFWMMAGMGINQFTSMLYEKSDSALLLSSPCSPASILTARLLSPALSAFLAPALFLVPFINAIGVCYSSSYLANYLLWAVMALLATMFATWTTLIVVSLLGARRAKVAIQIIGVTLGGLIYVVTQASTYLTEHYKAQYTFITDLFLHNRFAKLVAEASQGNFSALGLILLVTLLSVAITASALGKSLVHGLQDSAESGGRRTRAREGARMEKPWARSLFLATYRKELRLIARDHLLLAKTLPTLFYMIPASFGFVQVLGICCIAPAAVLLSGQLSGLLAHVASCGEEGWDLIAMSSVSELSLRRAKMAAGLTIPLTLALIALLVLACFGHPWIALLGLLMSASTAVACAWIGGCDIKATPRKDILAKGSKSGSPIGILMLPFYLVPAIGVGVAATKYWETGFIICGVMLLVSLLVVTTMKIKPASHYLST